MRSWLSNIAVLFGLSMVPVIELRGAVPLGVSMGLPGWVVLAVSVLGNMVPVPFIILFIRHIFAWMRKKSAFLENLVCRLEKRAHDKAEILYRYEQLGLYILVAVPLPGTGAWTGALIAALLNIRLKVAAPVIFAGVLTAGIVMMIVSYGVGALF